MRYQVKSELPRFQEFMLNEIYKLKGDATELTLEDRLNTAYKIIKNNDAIYKRFVKNDFFKSFLMTSKVLVFKTDKNQLIDIINISYNVLKGKEAIQKSYDEIKKELDNNNVIIPLPEKYTHRKKI